MAKTKHVRRGPENSDERAPDVLDVLKARLTQGELAGWVEKIELFLRGRPNEPVAWGDLVSSLGMPPSKDPQAEILKAFLGHSGCRGYGGRHGTVVALKGTAAAALLRQRNTAKEDDVLVRGVSAFGTAGVTVARLSEHLEFAVAGSRLKALCQGEEGKPPLLARQRLPGSREYTYWEISLFPPPPDEVPVEGGE